MYVIYFSHAHFSRQIYILGQSEGDEGDEDLEEDKIAQNGNDISDEHPNGHIRVKQECITPPSINGDGDDDLDNEVFDRKFTKSPTSGNGTESESDVVNDNVTSFSEGKVSLHELECLKSLCFPNDVLSLKKVDDSEIASVGRSYLVCSAIPLQTGSSIGPFSGELVSLSSIQQGDLVLQVSSTYKITTDLYVRHLLTIPHFI